MKVPHWYMQFSVVPWVTLSKKVKASIKNHQCCYELTLSETWVNPTRENSKHLKPYLLLKYKSSAVYYSQYFVYEKNGSCLACLAQIRVTFQNGHLEENLVLSENFLPLEKFIYYWWNIDKTILNNILEF